MLGKPDAGWTDFSLAEGKTYSLSYLTWVADDWLAQAIQGLKTLSQFAVEGYCEPDRMVCFVSFRHCHIILEEEDRSGTPLLETPYSVPVTMLEFCKRLHDDVRENLEDWVHWNDTMTTCSTEDEAECGKLFEQRRQALSAALDELAALIDQRAEAFETHCHFQ